MDSMHSGFQSFFQRMSQLIRAGSAFSTAVDPLAAGNVLLRRHSNGQSGDPLGIAVAAPGELDGLDHIAVQNDVDLGLYEISILLSPF